MAPSPAPETVIETRVALHRVAEHVLSAALNRATGDYCLRPGPDGFRTPPFGADGRVLAVVGTDIAVRTAQGERRAALTTIRDAAAFAGTEPGYPSPDGSTATPFEPDVPLRIDADAARVLADWFALGADALELFTTHLAAEVTSDMQLYPEHFDLGITAEAINYGASPGDESIPDPYVYVGPHGGALPGDDFWNAPFGAYRTIHEVRTAAQAAAFFNAGRERALAGRTVIGRTS